VTTAEERRYKMRGLPCRDAAGKDMPWCVCGKEDYTLPDGGRVTGGGILEWCWDQEDAENLLRQMQQDPRFSDLSAQMYCE